MLCLGTWGPCSEQSRPSSSTKRYTNYGAPGQVFDGYSSGRLTVQEQSQLPSGTYFYVLEYDYEQGDGLKKHQKAGYIHLSTD